MTDRWQLTCNENKITATPLVEPLTEYIVEASNELTRKIREQEERWIMELMPNDALHRLAQVCLKEIQRRGRI